MPGPKTITLADGLISGPGNVAKTIERAGVSEEENVSVQYFCTTWNSASVYLEISLNANESPANWSRVQRISDDGTLADVVLGQDGAISLKLPGGVWFRPNVSAGSPQPSGLTMYAKGDIEAA